MKRADGAGQDDTGRDDGLSYFARLGELKAESKMKVAVKMETESVGGRKLWILGALLCATLAAGCYGPGWGGGGPGWGGGGYYGGGYYGGGYSTDYFRGWGGDRDYGGGRSIFGGFAPARETFAASTRGRTSYSSAGARSGGGEERGGGGGGGERGGGGGHSGGGGGGGHR